MAHWTEDLDNIEVMPDPAPSTTGTRRYFHRGKAENGFLATVVGPDWLNMVQNEILNAVEGAGLKPDKRNHTQLFQAIQMIAGSSGVGGILPWDAATDYDLPALVWGSDHLLYIAVIPSGPGKSSGPRDPVTSDGYWHRIYAAASGGGISDLVYPTAFHEFYEKTPPDGWMVRNGALITFASQIVPELYAALRDEKNAWKCITEDAWQSMSATFPPDKFSELRGIGGVPYFVLDTAADTIRLPDTRGMYQEEAGFDGLAVGGTHGDSIRNLTGTITRGTNSPISFSTGIGVFSLTERNNVPTPNSGSSSSGYQTINMDASQAVPTSTVNQPRAFGVLGCVYVGRTA